MHTVIVVPAPATMYPHIISMFMVLIESQGCYLIRRDRTSLNVNTAATETCSLSKLWRQLGATFSAGSKWIIRNNALSVVYVS